MSRRFLHSPRRRQLLAAAAAAALLRPSVAAALAGTSPYASPGPHGVGSRDETWRDPSRARDLPIRLYVPEGARSTLPLVVFSHGLGGSVAGGATWGRHWASHGYLCLHLQHPGSDERLWRDRARQTPKDALRQGFTPAAYLDRIRDVHFALDEAARRQRAEVAPWPRADLARIGMSGHSFGARTTLAVVGERLPWPAEERALAEPRVRAAIAFSPAAPAPAAGWPARFGGIAVPVLSVTGTRDGDPFGGSSTPENRREPYRHMPPPRKYLLVLDGADHMVFNGRDGMPQARVANVVTAVTLQFWNATLRDDAAAQAWLANEARALLVAGDTFEWK
jgi:predicted dienelactone hydrolase